MSRTRRGYALMFFRIACLHRKYFLPVFPVAIFEKNGNGGANGLSMAHSRDKMRGVFFDLHPAAAAKSLLPSPKLAINELLIDIHARRNPGDEGHQGLTVGFTGSKVTQHRSCLSVFRL